jgi:hypothetical protein
MTARMRGKLESRNPKSETMQAETGNSETEISRRRQVGVLLAFGFAICFELRTSDFEFHR